MNKTLIALAVGMSLLSSCNAQDTNSEKVVATTQVAKEVSSGPKASVTGSSLGKDEKLNKFFDVLAENDRVVGSFAIYQGGEEVFDRAFIIQDGKVVETEESYRYKIGSISKTFTATLVFQMIEQGKLSLDTKLSKYFPEVPNADKITIKMMLNHRSGLFNYTNHEEFGSYFQEPQNQKSMLARIKTYEPAFEPDEKGDYSNTNFLLLGYILENISGKDYGELVENKITKPLGLKETYLEDITEPEKNEVFSYNKRDGWEKIPQWEMSSADAAGAIVSSTHDLNIFFKSLFDGKLISESSLKTMIEITDSYGHGIFDRKVDVNGEEKVGYWHGGRIENFSSGMTYFPEDKIGVVTLVNGDSYRGSKINKVLIDAAFNKDFDIPEFKVIELTEEELKPFVGEYASDTHPLGIKVMLNDGKLFAQADGQGAFPLTAVNKNKFEYMAAGIEVEFDSENQQFVIHQGGRADIFVIKGEKNEAKKVKVETKVLESYVGVYKSDSFPLDIEVMIKEGDLYAQATGQGAFPLSPKSETEFTFNLAGIKVIFDAGKKQLAITQGGETNILTKK